MNASHPTQPLITVSSVDAALAEPRRHILPSRRLRAVLVSIVVALAITLGAAATRTVYRQILIHTPYAAPPEGMVLVPAGYFWIGTDDPAADPDERPARRDFLPAFYIDAHEVTNRDFKRFKPDFWYPEGADDLPATLVLRPEAIAYAKSIGKRLPTNAEWEKAARGTDGRRYPWGDEYEAGKANIGLHTPLNPVGGFPAGASPYGCLDMAGNAWEWVSDTHRDHHWLGIAWGPERGIIRGGAHGYGPYQARATYQGWEGEDSTCSDVGFRCVTEAVPRS